MVCGGWLNSEKWNANGLHKTTREKEAENLRQDR
jgi:hypothetical protein